MLLIFRVHLVRGNFILLFFLFHNSKIGRRSALHVSDGCFALFSVSIVLPRNSVYRNRFNDAILRNQENGIISKLLRDVNWEAKKIASGGRIEAVVTDTKKSRAPTPEERSLNLVDTEGMFMFLGIGYLIAVGVLISEWVGGCTNRVIGIMKRRKAEKVEQEERDKHPSRRESFLEKFSRKASKASSTKSRRSSMLQQRKASKDTCSIGSAKSMTGLSKQTLQELYDGPHKVQPSIVFLDGKMVHENKMYEAHREAMEKIEQMENVSTDSSILTDENAVFRNKVSTIVEINRQSSPPINLSRKTSEQLETIEEGVFGEKVLY